MLIFSFGLSRQVKAIESDKQRINRELLKTRELMIDQLETINDLKDKVLSRVMESRLYPEFARLFSVMNDILYVQAVGNFSKIVYRDEGMENAIEIQASLKDIETCFDETVFIRIHKTYLIKQGQKVTLQRRSTADYEIVSRHFVLPVGRTYGAKLRQMLSND
jgi:DNA-binding LytR/AlgR family response regulator